MILCSALYYMGSLADPQSLVRDNRFYPGKAVESFPLWWQYVRRHYPDLRVVLFVDTASPIPCQPLIDAMGEPHEIVTAGGGIAGPLFGCKLRVVEVDQFAGQYFRPMQRNLVEAIILAYELNEDLFWLDADAFLNTDIRPLVSGCDAAASSIAHHQMTMDSVCTFISSRRLHALDELGVDLPSVLRNLLANGPTETRMHTFQEGGLYKLFGWGRTKAFGSQINMAHLSCYQHFLSYLEANPLDTPAYHDLRRQLTELDMGRLNGVELSFPDMLFQTTP